MELAHGLTLNMGNLFQIMQYFQGEATVMTKYGWLETSEENQEN